MTTTRRIFRGLGAAALAPALMLLAAPFTDVAKGEDFYRGKTVTIIVGYTPGGGYDLYARTLGRHLGKHLPGNPNVIVQNMAGAGSLRAANHLFTTAPADGTQFGTFSRTLPLLALTESGDNVRFDPLKFTWIGTTASYADDAYLFTVRREAGITSVRELIGTDRWVTFGSTSFGSTGFDVPLVLKETLRMNIRLIHGYPGGNQISLAIERGEMDGRTQGLSSLNSTDPDWQSKRVTLLQFARGMDRHPTLPDVPTALEIATREEDRQLIRVMESAFFLARPFAGPPGIPADRTAMLRKAFMDAQADPGYIADGTKLNFDISPRDGESVARIVAEIMATPQSLIDQYSSILANPQSEPRQVDWEIVEGTIVTNNRGRLEFTGTDGATYQGRAQSGYTTVLIGGAEKGPNDIAEGMTCKLWWEGNRSSAGRIECGG